MNALLPSSLPIDQRPVPPPTVPTTSVSPLLGTPRSVQHLETLAPSPSSASVPPHRRFCTTSLSSSVLMNISVKQPTVPLMQLDSMTQK